MYYADVAVPLGGCWSSPFAKWQGRLAEFSSLDVAVAVTDTALLDRGIDRGTINGVVLGTTIPQPEVFFGVTTMAARLGLPHLTGPMISQACATSVASLNAAAGAVTAGAGAQLVVATDRTSNGPLLAYPAPSRQGGAPLCENWVLDNFARDPWAGQSMLAAGERVAAQMGATKSQLDDLTALRWSQYQDALADDRAFHRRYMVPIHLTRGKIDITVDGDEGVRPKDRSAIAQLDPVGAGGVHTYASQTHPADGAAGAVVTTTDHARELAGGAGIARVVSVGLARAGKSLMPQAPVPAAMNALKAANLTLSDIAEITTHNPFAVNDLYFSSATGVSPDKMNRYGCSLIFGHPQGPTGLRSIIELIEALRARGGGFGLFTGCAAGDSAAAAVIEVAE